MDPYNFLTKRGKYHILEAVDSLENRLRRTLTIKEDKLVLYPVGKELIRMQETTSE